MKQIAFLDMDGVLSDFNAQAQKMCHIDTRGFLNRTTALTPVEQKQQEHVFHYADFVDEFWKSMPCMPDAQAVFSFVRQSFDDVIILSKFVPPQNRFDRLTAVRRLKQAWFYKNICTDYPRQKLIISNLPKSHYMPQNAQGVLIDDQMSNISTWENAGGKGIFYQNFEDLKKKITLLKSYSNERLS